MSASQDGKLIVWDGYTTNKVRKEDDLNDLNFYLMNIFTINWDTEYRLCLFSLILREIILYSFSLISWNTRLLFPYHFT